MGRQCLPPIKATKYTSSSTFICSVVCIFHDEGSCLDLGWVSTQDNCDEVGFVDARRSFGGHVNYETFLKTVSYFGPNDEFVVSGSDSGHAFVWNTEDRSLVA